MKIQQFCSVSTGYAFREAVAYSPNSKVKMIQSKNIKNGSFSVSDIEPIEIEPDKTKGHELYPGDLLLNAKGIHQEVILIDQSIKKDGFTYIAAPNFFVIRIKTDLVSPEYLVWILSQSYAKRYFEVARAGTRTNNIRTDQLKSIDIPIPDIKEQATIIKIRENQLQQQKIISSMIENMERINQKVTQDLYKDHHIKSN